jgi:hypothetical protein
MVSLAMPTAHKLLVLFGVADCGWPLSCSVVRSMLPSFPSRKDIAYFSFSGEDTAAVIMMRMAPLCGGLGALVGPTGHC